MSFNTSDFLTKLQDDKRIKHRLDAVLKVSHAFRVPDLISYSAEKRTVKFDKLSYKYKILKFRNKSIDVFDHLLSMKVIEQSLIDCWKFPPKKSNLITKKIEEYLIVKKGIPLHVYRKYLRHLKNIA
jgi:hypothetical protein